MSVVIENATITLRELCKALEVELPAKYESIADEKQTMAFRSKKVKKGDICLIIRSPEELHTKSLTSKDQYDIAIEKGAKMVIMGRENFEKYNLNEDDFPVILIDEAKAKVDKFFDQVRELNHSKVVMLTGSVGKTTTKDLCYTVTKNRFKTFANSKNTNTPHQVAKHMFDYCTDDNEVYIQEAGAGYRGSVRISAQILKPDIFILTNVYKHHFQVYKTMKNLFGDKTSADDTMPDDGIIITNYDDEQIRNHQFRHTVKSFAIDYPDADFRAINIVQDLDILRFDIVVKETQEIVPIAVKILGEHNVYNALAAYVLARTLGVSNEDIQEDFLTYRAEGVRQNFSNVGGVYIDMDCYNVAEESIVSMLKAGEKFKLQPGAKKYALIGGENKLGKDVRERSQNFGKELVDIKFDKFLFCATTQTDEAMLNKYGDAVSIYNGFKTRLFSKRKTLSKSIDDMIKFLQSNVKKGDLVMCKGIYLLDMPIAVDKVFGTSYSFGLSNYKETMKRISENGCVTNLIADFGELELVRCKADDGSIVIPSKIKGYPVFRIANKAFANKSDITSVDFGGSIKNIGECSFMGCDSIKTITVPSNVKVIENSAFEGCSSLESVLICDGVTHIGSKAFANCDNLREITLPSSIGKIEDNAFDKNSNVTIACKSNSYAYSFAKDHGLSVKAL